MRFLSTTLGLTLFLGLVGCSSSDQRKANEQAHEAGREVSDEAKKAGREIKKDAKELGQKVDAAVGPEGGTASEKMAHVDAKLDRAALVGKVKAKLAADAGLSTLANVEVVVNGGIVTLTGTAASEDQRKSAELAASQVDGVTKVRNHIAVRP
jgi:osmotically-inducible protein OsmY